MSAISSSSKASSFLSQQARERRWIDQVARAVLIALLLVTAVTYIIMPIQAVSWLKNPFPGSVLEYPLTANPDITGETFYSSMEMASDTVLHVNDTVLSVNDTPVANAMAFYRELRKYSVGDTVDMTVVNDDGTRRTVPIKLQEMPLATILFLFLVPYVAGLFYIGIGLWVYRNRRQHIIGRTFLMMCAGIALTLATTFDLWTTHLFVRVWMAILPLTAGVMVTFALVYPSEAAFVARRPTLQWVPAGLGFVLLVYGQIIVGGASHTTVVDTWYISYIFAGAAIGLFLLIMLLRGLFAVSPSVREQSRVVFGGALLSFTPFVLDSLNLLSLPIGWVLAAFLIFPLVVGYSIIQYSVLDTNRLASFTATYTIMAAAVTLGFALIISGINYIASAVLMGSIESASPVMLGILAFILVLVFEPVRRRLQDTIDSFFFRSQAEFQERLTSFRHDLTVVSGLSDVIRLLKQQIREGLVPTHTYIFLRDARTGDFIAAGESSRPDTDVRFEAQSGLVHALSTTRDVIFLEYNKPLPPELLEDHAKLAILRTPVLVPLQGQNRLAGWIAVGNKRSGERFSAYDLRFVLGLAEQASLAVERAQVIGDLERRVRELDVLSQVSQAVNFSTDPDVLLELLYTQTSKLIDTTNFYIIMHNAEIKGLSYAFFLEDDERRTQWEGSLWPDDQGLAAEVVRTGRPIRTDNYNQECARRGVEPLRTQHNAWMGVPLNAGTRTLGVMVVANQSPGVTFTDDHLKVFWAIADQAATALDKARLFSETETRAKQLATLNEISKELSSLDLENLLGRIMRAAVDIIGTEAGTLYLIDEETSEIVFRVVEGGAQDLVGTRLKPGTGIVGQAVDEKHHIIVNDVLKDKHWLSDVDRETEFQTRSLLSVPMLIQDASIGVLQLINRSDGKPFTEEDATLLTTFASQAAVAIDNARLYEATDAELAKRVDELQNMQRIDRELNRTLELDRVIRITLDWAQRITGARAGVIAMLNQDESGLEILASNGYSEEFIETYSTKPFPLNRGIIGRIISTGKPEFVHNVTDDPDFEATSDIKTVEQITVPILRANRPIGVLVLESDIAGLFNVQDFDFAQRLVEHAAVAIENARLVQEVQEANRSKTEFIGFVAHELKNPMTSIRGYTDLMKGGQVGEINDMQAQFLGTIRNNVDRMSRLVSDLRDVARIETGYMRLELSPTSVKAVIDETVSGLVSQIEGKSQELVLNIPDDLPQINADHTRLVQVMTNLLSNAHKYTPEGGRIEVSAEVTEIQDERTGDFMQAVHHRVTDTGIGMDDSDLEQLFTKFFRTTRSKDMASGTGLGLNISKSLVEQHNGRIWVESEVGVGSTFHYTIPVFVEKESADEPEPALE